MAAAAAAAGARLLRAASGPLSARSLPTTLPTIPFRRSFSKQIDPRIAQVAEDLAKLLKEPFSEETNVKAQALVKELHSFYPEAAVENKLTVKSLERRIAEVEKDSMKLHLQNKYFAKWTWGMFFMFAGSIMTVPAGVYYARHDHTTLVENVKTLSGRVTSLEEGERQGYAEGFSAGYAEGGGGCEISSLGLSKALKNGHYFFR